MTEGIGPDTVAFSYPTSSLLILIRLRQCFGRWGTSLGAQGGAVSLAIAPVLTARRRVPHTERVYV